MHFVDSPAVLEFVGSARCGGAGAAIGTTCPDHFLRTRDPAAVRAVRRRRSRRRATLLARLDGAARGATARDYAGLLRALQARRLAGDARSLPGDRADPGRRPGSRSQKDKATARVAAEFYVNAINVMRGAEGVDALRADLRAGRLRHRVLAARGGQAAAAAEAEEPGGPDRAGHRRRGRDRRRHRAPAARRGRLGRCCSDVDAGGARRGAARAPEGDHGKDRVRGVRCDVTRRGVGARVAARARVREFGGLDILVSNAGHRLGVAVRGDDARGSGSKNIDILATGYFLVSREAFRADEAPGARRLDRVRGQQERAGRLAGRLGLLRGEGGGAAPRALPRARRAPSSASAPTSSTRTR